MAKQTINLGTAANNGNDGDDARTAFNKVNDNFTEVYALASGAQPANAKLTALASAAWAANQLQYQTGAGAVANTPLTAAGRALLDDADASAQRATLGLGNAAVATLTVGNNDSTAGRTTKVGDYGWGGNAGMTPPNNNADDITMGGVYSVSGSTSGVPAGYASGSSILHVPWSSGGASHQMIFAYNGTGLAWRRRHATSGWADWNIIFSTASVIPVANGGTGANTPSGARTALQLGSASTQDVVSGPLDNTANRLLATGAGGLLSATLNFESGTDTWYGNRFKGWNGTAATEGPPVSVVSYGVDLGYSTNRRFKMAIDLNGSPWFTGGTAIGVVNSWKKGLLTSDMVGTVSQASGLPTGAIIERGSNANGDYVRYADGTQIVWKYNAVMPSAPVGGTSQLAVTYPIAFAGAFAVVNSATVSPYGNNDQYGVIGVANNSSTGIIFVARNGTTAAQQFSLNYMSIGRWF